MNPTQGATQQECAKIACTTYNAAAIDQEGQLLVWGSNRNCLLGHPNQGIQEEQPALFGIEGLDFFDRIEHIALGLSHAGVIVQNTLFRLIDQTKQIAEQDEEGTLTAFLERLRDEVKMKEFWSSKYLRPNKLVEQRFISQYWFGQYYE